MTLIKPTDIMLGRGSTCYNNPGNKVFRQVLKEHVMHYRNQALRKEKAALVKMLVSKLEAMGYRFLQQSTTATYVEAPPHLAENKVAHCLRDLRLSNAKLRDDVNVLPKNFRPFNTEQTNADQVMPVITGEAHTTEEMFSMESNNTAAITMDVDPYLHGPPTKLQLDANSMVSSPTNMAFGFSSALREYPLADGGREEADPSSFAYVFEDASERGAHGSLCSPGSELEQRLEHLERSWNNITDTLFPETVSEMTCASHHAHDLDSVGVAFNMYAADNGRSIGNTFVGDPYQPLGCDVDDAQSLCRWFSSHLS
jgi:hypothetical protein